ncbi:ABC transporter ATP-binding protein [Algoriphagus confluentis]|uniref:ABC transporter ATP-binding protein n=1 Tax=Algoriphagus confluentis TaxID=1697556 RepID=A0ABQ6PNN4_9BACT|nr:ABC transporter ATP-binding protein [Algoriphagus confluentis]
MLEIQLQEVSKRFQYEWIFKNLNLILYPGSALAITGGNGSGKSTLLKCMAGVIPITSGRIQFILDGKEIDDGEKYNYLSLSAPYLEVPEEFTLSELIRFHFKFKKLLAGISENDLLEILFLTAHRKKKVAQFSSGMKQRLKLGLAVFSDVPLVLLDEPTSNLDQKGVQWYQDLISRYQMNRTLLVCSNDPREYEFSTHKIALEDYK